MKKTEIDSLIFDLDGTLIDSKRDLALAMQFVLEKMGSPMLDEDTIISFVGDGLESFVECATGIKDKDKIAEAAKLYGDYYSEHFLDNTDAYPGVIETLEYFKDKKMAVLSNKPIRFTIDILEALDMKKYFKGIFGGDSYEKKKPHPEPLIATIDFLKTGCDKAVMVGDSFHDVQAGKAAGVLTCGILGGLCEDTRLLESKPDVVIKEFRGLQDLFI